FYARGGSAGGDVVTLMAALPEGLRRSWGLLLPPPVIAGGVARRTPGTPARAGAGGRGGGPATTSQAGARGATAAAGYGGYVSETGIAAVDELLSNGGLENMLGTVALIMCALAFGGIMERTGMLGVLAEAILRAAKSSGSLVAATLATCVGVNI